jgi:membrane associated rhomboid family serine protease
MKRFDIENAMIPIRDHNPTTRTPYVTVALIVTCVLIFLWQVSLGPNAGQAMVQQLGFIPALLFGHATFGPEGGLLPAWSTLFTSMFLHGGFMHLAGNMLYLWVFGNNIEDVMGHGRFLVFYLLCGLAAAMAQALPDMGSIIPMIGASGAISGVLGAYLLLFPKAQVQVLIPIGFLIMRTLPAGWLLGFWIVFQVFSGFASGVEGGGVAWWAHVGGFVAGMALIHLFREKTSDPTATASVGRARDPNKPTPLGRSRIPDSRSVPPERPSPPKPSSPAAPPDPPTVQRRRDP